ncbi:MAG: molybdenum ABC transporter ATP-binding protein [Pseudomonadota bacterium]
MNGLRVQFNAALRARAAAEPDGFALDVDLTLPQEGITALFGHSGSGKTTCLRVIAGLERIVGARVSFGEEIWQDDARGIFVPVHKRALGYVFQEASLFDHLTVRGNLEFGLKRVPPHERRFSPEAIADLLGIAALLEQRPARLSGGERQRAAIARALLASPRIILMDEPLAALDFRRKREILPYLEQLRDELSIPIIYVSHAPDEVARLADHLVLLDEGKVLANGPLAETLARVDLPFNVGPEIGAVFDAVLTGHETADLSCLTFPGGTLTVGRRAESIGSRLRCRVDARDVGLSLTDPRASGNTNSLPAEITAIAAATSSTDDILVQLRVGPTPFLARVTARLLQEFGIGLGRKVWVEMQHVALLS